MVALPGPEAARRPAFGFRENLRHIRYNDEHIGL